jgi:hypothetical protein
MVNDYERFNKEIASDSLEWHIMKSPDKMIGTVLLASRVTKVCQLHID